VARDNDAGSRSHASCRRMDQQAGLAG
jgi:hypothetical protein